MCGLGILGIALHRKRECLHQQVFFTMTSPQQKAEFASPTALEEIQSQLRARASADVNITPDTNITRDLGLDSLAIMDFIFDLEDSFDISIPMERIAEVQTITDLAEVIETLRKEAS